uniref:Uncharacterized protein n=1 Tax=Romanomermis culicivorax TaxID=13658 RepID=A0A915JQS0_ROMCU
MDPTSADVDDDHCNQKRAQKLLISAKESADPSAVLSSFRKLRYCLTDEQSCSNFRLNDGLSNLMVLLKKFTREFVSILNKKMRNEEKGETSESNEVNLSKSISEILGLLANCSYMDNGAKIVLTTITTLSSICKFA